VFSYEGVVESLSANILALQSARDTTSKREERKNEPASLHQEELALRGLWALSVDV
jgi:hypothetical protein